MRSKASSFLFLLSFLTWQIPSLNAPYSCLAPMSTIRSPANINPKIFSKKALKNASQILARQDANVILEKQDQSGRWVFRRGAIDLEIDSNLSQQLGDILEGEGQASILLSLRKHSPSSLLLALKQILRTKKEFSRIFSLFGIKSFYQYKKVLLVAPFGDMEGRPLKYAVPHKGLEAIAYRLRREREDVDALVYNPNLGSREDLYSHVSQHHYDVIGVSILQTVLKANLEILGQLALICPHSLFIAGGSEIGKFPLRKVFESWPVDILSLDGGSSLIRILGQIEPRREKSKNIGACANIGNIAYVEPSGEVISTKEENESFAVTGDSLSEVPFDKPDLLHGKQYVREDDFVKLPIAFDRIGRNPTRISFGNYCKGNCIFCGTELNTRRDFSAQSTVQLINAGKSTGDSVHFESADFLFDPEGAQRVAEAIIADPTIRAIPKMAIARVDEIGDGTIFSKLYKAGFRIIAFGIESFDDHILKRIGKQTSAKQNIKALELCINSGIKPGLNLILLSPWDTIKTTVETISYSLHYLERGAYINVVPYLFAGFGRAMTQLKDILDEEIYNFPGLKAPFVFPRLGKILDPELASLRHQIYDKLYFLQEHNSYPEWAKNSVTIYSLFIFKATLLVFLEAEIKGVGDLNQLVQRVDLAIDRVICAEKSTLPGGSETLAGGILRTIHNPFNKLLTEVILQTEDSREIILRVEDDYYSTDGGKKLPCQLVYNIHEASKGRLGPYKGFVVLETNGTKVSSFEVHFRRIREGDVFYHRIITHFIDSAVANPGLLLNPEVDFRRTGPSFVRTFDRKHLHSAFQADRTAFSI